MEQEDPFLHLQELLVKGISKLLLRTGFRQQPMEMFAPPVQPLRHVTILQIQIAVKFNQQGPATQTGISACRVERVQAEASSQLRMKMEEQGRRQMAQLFLRMYNHKGVMVAMSVLIIMYP